MKARARRQGGFTLAELMAVVVIVGVLASMATVSLVKGRGESQLDGFTNRIRNLMVTARNRAITTHSTYLVDVRATTVQLCQVDPTVNPSQAACPTPVNTSCGGAACENSRVFDAGFEGLVAGSNTVVDRTGMAPGVLPGGKQTVYFFRDGTADYRTSATAPQPSQLHQSIETGVTLYLRGTSATMASKQRKILVLPAAGRPRIIDRW